MRGLNAPKRGPTAQMRGPTAQMRGPTAQMRGPTAHIFTGLAVFFQESSETPEEQPCALSAPASSFQ